MSCFYNKALGAGAAMVALSAFVPNLNIIDKAADLNLKLIGSAHAQATKTASLDFSASVFNPLVISLGASLQGGKFGIGGAGSIIVQPGGGTTANNQVVVTAGINGVVTVKAPNGATFSLSLTKFGGGNNIYIATPLGGGAGATPSKTMTITQVKINASTTNMNSKAGVFATTNPKVTGYIITVGSSGTLDVGATIVIDGSEVPGTYTGSTVITMSL